VQTRMRLPCPATLACTGRKLMFQRRLVTLWAWLMRFPACGFLPQISHCCAMTAPESFRSCRANLDFTGPCPVRQSRVQLEGRVPSRTGLVPCLARHPGLPSRAFTCRRYAAVLSNPRETCRGRRLADLYAGTFAIHQYANIAFSNHKVKIHCRRSIQVSSRKPLMYRGQSSG
jgi:hypothetical protein